jgi:hypothetical protein
VAHSFGELEAGVVASVIGAPLSVVIGGLGSLITQQSPREIKESDEV